jgi:hypothetical protein
MSYDELSRTLAVPAYKVHDSIGVCTHAGWINTNWQTVNWTDKVIELGVKHIRSDFGTNNIALNNFKKLFTVGVKLNALMPRAISLDTTKATAWINWVATNIGGSNLSGIESLNEFNNSSRPTNWVTVLRNYQAWLYKTVKSNTKISNVPVIGPSIWMRLTKDYTAVGNLEPNLDKGCIHYYTAARRPTRVPINSGTEVAMEQALTDAKILAPTKKLWATEYGYDNPAPGAALTSWIVNENVAAKYLVREVFDLYVAGVERSFIYALMDDPGTEHYWGLTNAGGTPKKQFLAIKNLISLLKDESGKDLTDRQFDYTIGNSTVKKLLMHQSNGAILLALYQDVDSYNRTTKKEIIVNPVSVPLSFPSNMAKIEVIGVGPELKQINTVTNVNNVTVSVADSVVIVRITP